MPLYSKIVKITKKMICRKDAFTMLSGININAHVDAIGAFSSFALGDPETIKEMRSFLALTSDKHCLLDICALYGFFSLAFTSNNPQRKAYAIEPSFKPFKIMRYNLRFNPELDIKPFRVALGASEGNVKMKYEWQHLVAIGKNENTPNYINIKMTTPDKFLESLGEFPDVIKIDTEGYEFDIL